MVFDVMIREKVKNEAGKQIVIVYRMHDTVLSRCLREAQDEGRYIISVIPLFRSKLKDVVSRPIIDNEDKKAVEMNSIGGYTPSDDFDGF